jgi:hypothetical protein
MLRTLRNVPDRVDREAVSLRLAFDTDCYVDFARGNAARVAQHDVALCSRDALLAHLPELPVIQ